MSSRYAESLRSGNLGTAVVMAMLTVALIASVATAVLADYAQAVSHLSGRHDQAQARWVARAAIDWSRWILLEDSRTDAIAQKMVDHRSEIWLTKVDKLPYEEGEISGEIRDDSGKYNLNALVSNGVPNPKQVVIFKRLLAALGIPTNEGAELTAALLDWLDTDQQSQSSRNTEASWYRSQPGRRIPPDAPLIDVSELAHIRGFESPALLETLKQHVTVHPPGNHLVNVNFATPEVLAAITGLDVSTSHIRDATRTVQTPPFLNKAEFIAKLPTGLQYDQNLLAVQSTFFVAVGTAKWGEAVVSMEVMLRRTGGRPEILWYKII